MKQFLYDTTKMYLPKYVGEDTKQKNRFRGIQKVLGSPLDGVLNVRLLIIEMDPSIFLVSHFTSTIFRLRNKVLLKNLGLLKKNQFESFVSVINLMSQVKDVSRCLV